MRGVTPAVTEITTPGGRLVAVGQHWLDEGYLMRVVAVSEDWVWVRHVNARGCPLQTHPAWFDEWILTLDPAMGG